MFEITTADSKCTSLRRIDIVAVPAADISGRPHQAPSCRLMQPESANNKGRVKGHIESGGYLSKFPVRCVGAQ